MINEKFLKECYDKAINETFFKGKKTEIIDFNFEMYKKIKEEYYPEQIIQDWYDDEPETEDEEFNMYLDYKEKLSLKDKSEIEENQKFSKEKHSEEVLKQAYIKVMNKYKEFEERRLQFNNWEEPYVNGINGCTQKSVDNSCNNFVNDALEVEKNIKLPFRFSKVEINENQFCLFLFLRDILYYDVRIYFTKNGFNFISNKYAAGGKPAMKEDK